MQFMTKIPLAERFKLTLHRLERLTLSSTFPELGMFSYPLNAIRTLTEFLGRSFLLMVRGSGSLRKLRKIANSMSEKSLVVLANGPSIQKLDSEKVATKVDSGELSLLVINNFFRTELAKELTPSFYLLSDPFHRPDSPEPVAKQLWVYLENNPTVMVFVPRHWTCVPKVFSDRIIYFEDRSLEGISKNISPVKPRGYVSLTALKALSIGVHLGFHQIHLCGFDNNLFKTLEVDEGNNLIQVANHAEGGATNPSQDVTKFFPNGMADYFFDLAITAFQTKRLFGAQAINNLDKHSMTDAFEKVDPLGLMIGEAT
jgi:hypothetical protein